MLPVRIELTTSALPRMRSTTELRQHGQFGPAGIKCQHRRAYEECVGLRQGGLPLPRPSAYPMAHAKQRSRTPTAPCGTAARKPQTPEGADTRRRERKFRTFSGCFSAPLDRHLRTDGIADSFASSSHRGSPVCRRAGTKLKAKTLKHGRRRGACRHCRRSAPREFPSPGQFTRQALKGAGALLIGLRSSSCSARALRSQGPTM